MEWGSPFVSSTEGIQLKTRQGLYMSDLKVSHSQLSTFSRCEFKYFLDYEWGWRPKEKPVSMARGTLLHEALASYYNGKPPYDIVTEIMSSSSDYVLVAHIAKILDRYFNDYAPVVDEFFEVLEVESHHEMQIETPKGNLFTLQMYLDLLVKDRRNDKVWLVDHKTSGRPGDWNATTVALDTQMGFYSLILRQAGIDVWGAIHNIINTYDYKNYRTEPIDKLFKREKSYRPQEELDNIALEVGQSVDRLLEIKGTNYRRRNLTKDCSWCVFQDPCLGSLRGIPIEQILEANYDRKGDHSDPPHSEESTN